LIWSHRVSAISHMSRYNRRPVIVIRERGFFCDNRSYIECDRFPPLNRRRQHASNIFWSKDCNSDSLTPCITAIAYLWWISFFREHNPPHHCDSGATDRDTNRKSQKKVAQAVRYRRSSMALGQIFLKQPMTPKQSFRLDFYEPSIIASRSLRMIRFPGLTSSLNWKRLETDCGTLKSRRSWVLNERIWSVDTQCLELRSTLERVSKATSNRWIQRQPQILPTFIEIILLSEWYDDCSVSFQDLPVMRCCQVWEGISEPGWFSIFLLIPPTLTTRDGIDFPFKSSEIGASFRERTSVNDVGCERIRPIGDCRKEFGRFIDSNFGNAQRSSVSWVDTVPKLIFRRGVRQFAELVSSTFILTICESPSFDSGSTTLESAIQN
jgi:hypothetical protein